MALLRCAYDALARPFSAPLARLPKVRRRFFGRSCAAPRARLRGVYAALGAPAAGLSAFFFRGQSRQTPSGARPAARAQGQRGPGWTGHTIRAPVSLWDMAA